MSYIQIAVTANRAGLADPHPWFTDACSFAFANDIEEAIAEANGEKPKCN